jgi:uncharacterized membrane protein
VAPAPAARGLLSVANVALPSPVHDNLDTIAQLRERSAHAVTVHQRMFETVATRLGRPRAAYALGLGVVGWIAYNSVAPRFGWRELDQPPFFWLQGTISLLAAFTAILVLVAQTRQRLEQEDRAHLELQINLLAEQKTTKIIALLEELRHDLPGVPDRDDPVARAMQEEVDANAVHSAVKR